MKAKDTRKTPKKFNIIRECLKHLRINKCKHKFKVTKCSTLMFDIVTILSSKGGWVFPCELRFDKVKPTSWQTFGTYYFVHFWTGKFQVDRECTCGKKCKPINVEVVIQRKEKTDGQE